MNCEIVTAARDATPDRWALVAVTAVWASMFGTLLSFALIYGYNVPWREDWVMVPALVGKEPHLLQWLWAQTMEHRTPIQRAVYLALLRATGGDFRIGMIADVLGLGFLCLAMTLIARRIRGGQTSLADAFFPLVLLHLGHAEHVFLGYNLQFLISIGLCCIWLLIIVGYDRPLSPKLALTAGLTLVLLPLSGGNGMLFTPFVALWLAGTALLYRREMAERWVFPFQVGCVIVSLAFVGLYFVGYEPATPPHAGVVTAAITAGRFVGMSLGPVGAGTGRVFPASLIGVGFCGLAWLLWTSALLPLSNGLRSARSAERFRLFGLLMFAAATTTLVVLMGWGRAGLVPVLGLPSRYALLSVPGLCAAYFAWILYGPDNMRNWAAAVFAAAALVALPFNMREGLGYRDAYVSIMQAFTQDLSDGMSWRELGKRDASSLMGWDPELVTRGLKMLHDAKMGPWKDVGH
jgi:hypothetical protein